MGTERGWMSQLRTPKVWRKAMNKLKKKVTLYENEVFKLRVICVVLA